MLNFHGMKRYIFSAMALLSVAFCAFAQDQVLMTIDGDPVMASEFMYIYEKNNQETAVTRSRWMIILTCL